MIDALIYPNYDMMKGEMRALNVSLETNGNNVFLIIKDKDKTIVFPIKQLLKDFKGVEKILW